MILIVFYFLFDIYLIIAITSNIMKTNSFVILHISLFVVINYIFIKSIKILKRFKTSINQEHNIELTKITNFDNTNKWFNQNCNLFPKNIFNSLVRFDSRNYFTWGCIESGTDYTLFIIDLSRNNEVISLNIEKKDLNRYDNIHFITKLIKQIAKKQKINQTFPRKYLHSHLSFYVRK